MKPLQRFSVYIALVLGTAVAAGWAAGESVNAQLNLFGSSSSSASPTPSPSPSPSATPTPTPIPLAGVVPESEVVARRIDQIKRSVLSDPVVTETRQTFETRQKAFDTSSAAAREELGGIPSLKTIEDIETEWRNYASSIAGLQTDLKEFSTELDDAEKVLAEMSRKWLALRQTIRQIDAGGSPAPPQPSPTPEKESGEQADGTPSPTPTPTPSTVPAAGMAVNEIPPTIRLKIDQTIVEIERAQTSLAEQRTALLSLQADIGRHEDQIEEIIMLARERRQSALSNLFARDVPPIWDPAARQGDRMQGLQGGFTEKLQEAQEHLLLIVFGIPFLIILSVLPLLALIRARRKARAILEEEPGLDKRLVFFTSPYATWALITIVWISAAIGRKAELVEVVFSLMVLVPGYYFLRRVAADSLVQIVNVLVVFYIFDTILPLFEGFPFLYRLLFAVEMGAGIALVLWLRRREPTSGIFESHSKFIAFLRKLAFISVIPFGIALFADFFGYLSLARVVSKGLLGSAYLAVFHYVFYLALVSLVVLLLRSWPLSRLRMMGEHKPLVLRKASVFFAIVLVISWISETLDQFFISDSVGGILDQVLNYTVTLGSFSIRVADVIVFLIVVWLAFAISRFIRFILEEDVYSRVELKDGVDYAASTIIHYVILFGGFTLAILSLGIDLTKFTILAGAFGVGLGFGLQNIVENFVSGVILLFERPVTVGDVIQRGEQVGDLKRIGLRASVMGTPEGAEVIVPNGVLLSEEVTNWTPASHNRRLDVNVGVAYGNDPQRIIELLVEVAKAHPEVESDPEPVALFVGFGDSSLDFQLRSWADSESKWWRTRSDIAIGVYNALNEAGVEIPFPQRDLNVRSISNAVPEEVTKLLGGESPPADETPGDD